MEKLSAKEYRAKAKEVCTKHEKKLTPVFLVYFVVMLAVGIINSLTGKTTVLEDGTVQTTTWFSSVFSFLAAGALAISLAKISEKVQSDVAVEIKDLLYGFNDLKRSVFLNLLIGIYTALWSLLLVIPGIVKTVAYSMAYFVANDNPELSANECITKSKEMMKGHKMEYFCLMLSYIGWILLSTLTLGILLIWVMPRMQQVSYMFYLNISGKKAEANTEPVEIHSI